MQFEGEAKEERHDIVPLAEETVSVRQEEIVTGRVRVQTRTETEDHLIEAELSEEQVEITRVPVNRVVQSPPSVRTEGDVTIVPVLEEVAVIETRLVLREELHIRKRTEQRTVAVPVTLRKQRAEIERDKETADQQDKEPSS